jgi:hypothetical protein
MKPPMPKVFLLAMLTGSLRASAGGQDDGRSQVADVDSEPMAADADRGFEVATIKPDNPEKQNKRVPPMGSQKFDLDGVADAPGKPNLPQLRFVIGRVEKPSENGTGTRHCALMRIHL